MDVTNPGLVNVADHVVGNPSVAVSSLAVPENDDVLVPIANQGTPRAEDVAAAGDSTGPTPSNSNVIQQQPASPSQSRGEIPGVAPQFLPFPQNNLVNTIEQQNIPQSQTAEFSVAAGTVIQTNQDAATQRDYTVTKVIDPDTGLPPVVPTPPLSGSFSSVQNTGGSTVTVMSPPTVPPLSNGDVINIAGTPSSLYAGPQQVGNVLALAGQVQKAINPGAGKTTLGSSTTLPAGLAAAKKISVTGAPYTSPPNAPWSISNVVSVSGNIDGIFDNSAVLPGTVVIAANAATTLAANQLIYLAATGYTGFGQVSPGTVVNVAGSFGHVTAGIGVVTIQAGSTTGLGDGRYVEITGSAHYNGIYKIQNVTPTTFDILWAGPYSDDAGSWQCYNFVVNIPYSGSTATGGWASNTFDINTAFTTDFAAPPANWTVYSFEITATYAGTASGTWSRIEPTAAPTTRLKLFVAPTDLLSFGISLLGRILTFDSNIPTVADRKATRPITYFGNDYVIIDVNEPDDPFVPVLAYPQTGDTFFIYVQRQNSEVFSDTAAASQNVDVFPPGGGVPAQPPAPNPFVPQNQLSMGTVDVSVGPQPNKPIITSGVQVPTAINVNVANQATSVGLPKNVYV